MRHITVLYHRDNDGFGSAYGVWAKYNKNTDVRLFFASVQYGESVPDDLPPETDHLYVVDFCYPIEVMEGLARKYKKITVIDHHRTAGKRLQHLTDVCDNATIIYDTTQAACTLTWRFLMTPVTPAILQYVADRDIWAFKLADSREVNLYISTLPWEFAVWDNFRLTPGVLQAGIALKKAEELLVDRAIRRADVIRLGQHRVAITNATDNISEVGNALCTRYQSADYALVYHDKNGVRICSLRSVGDFDVSRVAVRLGGGGHKNASGFTIPLSGDFERQLRSRLAD